MLLFQKRVGLSQSLCQWCILGRAATRRRQTHRAGKALREEACHTFDSPGPRPPTGGPQHGPRNARAPLERRAGALRVRGAHKRHPRTPRVPIASPNGPARHAAPSHAEPSGRPEARSGGRREIPPDLGRRGSELDEQRCFRLEFWRSSRFARSRAGLAEQPRDFVNRLLRTKTALEAPISAEI